MRYDLLETQKKQVVVGDIYRWGDGDDDNSLYTLKVKEGEIIFAYDPTITRWDNIWDANTSDHELFFTARALIACLKNMLEDNFSEFSSMFKSLDKDSTGYFEAVNLINQKLELLREEIAPLEDLINVAK